MGYVKKPGTVTRSAVPNDLRSGGPPGEVKTSWQPEAFTWSKAILGNKQASFLKVNKANMKISPVAAMAADIQETDRLQIGVNKTFIAVRKDPLGFKVKSGSGKSFCFQAAGTIKKLISEGYPIPCVLECQWDESSQMLVARWPSFAAEEQVHR
jgi:hypothetical protein